MNDALDPDFLTTLRFTFAEHWEFMGSPPNTVGCRPGTVAFRHRQKTRDDDVVVVCIEPLRKPDIYVARMWAVINDVPYITAPRHGREVKEYRGAYRDLLRDFWTLSRAVSWYLDWLKTAPQDEKRLHELLSILQSNATAGQRNYWSELERLIDNLEHKVKYG